MIRRGEVWWGDLPEPIGSGPGYRRPVLVVQSDDFNAAPLQTVIIVALTGNVALAEAVGNVLLPRQATRLPRDSVANVTQVLTLDRRLLIERVSALPRKYMERVDNGLRLALHL